jgi:hypothetical protein
MAKFVETVSPPDFGGSLRDGRMYEEEVPKAKASLMIDWLHVCVVCARVC